MLLDIVSVPKCSDLPFEGQKYILLKIRESYVFVFGSDAMTSHITLFSNSIDKIKEEYRATNLDVQVVAGGYYNFIRQIDYGFVTSKINFYGKADSYPKLDFSRHPEVYRQLTDLYLEASGHHLIIKHNGK